MGGYSPQITSSSDILSSEIVRKVRFEISEILTDISGIYRVSVKVDTIYPIDNQSTEISATNIDQL